MSSLPSAIVTAILIAIGICWLTHSLQTPAMSPAQQAASSRLPQ